MKKTFALIATLGFLFFLNILTITQDNLASPSPVSPSASPSTSPKAGNTNANNANTTNQRQTGSTQNRNARNSPSELEIQMLSRIAELERQQNASKQQTNQSSQQRTQPENTFLKTEDLGPIAWL